MKQIIESIGFKLQREDIQGYRGEFEYIKEGKIIKANSSVFYVHTYIKK